MRTICTRSIIAVLAVSLGLLYGQTTTSISLVQSSYPITTPAGFGGPGFSLLQLSVYYPAGLSSSSYASGMQLNSEFQSFLSTYPNPADAPEAYLSQALQDILNKYPAITGGALTALVSGPPQVIGGVPIPGTGTPIGSVYIAIGTLSSAALAIYTGVSGQAVSYSSISSEWTVTLPMGFTGQAFSRVSLGVLYPTGLPASSYRTSAQLNSDFQGFISNYPNAADPPEAYLSGALQGILTKYSQMPGATLGALISGPPQMIGGIPIPGTGKQIGSVNVAIGNFSTALGTLGLAGLGGQNGNVSAITSQWAVTTPQGFSGLNFSNLQLSVSYPTGLPASSYETSTQLNSDFQASLAAYPAPSDAAESYLNVALQAILTKYPQIPGGEINASIAGQMMPGNPFASASGGSITVIIGTYNPYLSTIGILGLLSRESSVEMMKRMPPAKSLPLSRR